MNKLATIILFSTVLTNFSYAKDVSSPTQTTQSGSDILATYYDKKVTSNEIMELIRPGLESHPEFKGKTFKDLAPEMQKTLVTNYVKGKLIEKRVDKSDIQNSQGYKDGLELYKSQLAKQEFVKLEIKKRINDQMIDGLYKEVTDKLKGKMEAKASHILLDTLEEAEKVAKELDEGASFEALVDKYSKDAGSKENKGELGYVVKGQLVPEFESKLFSMKKGEISGPVQTDFGVHIIKLLDKRNVTIPSKEEILSNLTLQAENKALNEYTSELLKEAKFELKL